MYVTESMNNFEGQEQRCGVEFSSVVCQDVFTLERKLLDKMRVGELGTCGNVRTTCSKVMKSPPGRYSIAKYKLSRS